MRHEAARFRRFGLENIGRNRWKIEHCPNSYEVVAIRAENTGHYRMAARMWHLASCVSLGHSRSARYDAAEARCKSMIVR